MSLLRDLLTIQETEGATASKAASVYHRDYVKTRNKKYRKYDKRKHQSKLNETLSTDDINKALDMLGTPDADEHALRRDLKVLKTLSEKTNPKKITVNKANAGYKATLKYENNAEKAHQLFVVFKETFGVPVHKSSDNGIVSAKFHDKETGTEITLSHVKSSTDITAIFDMKTGNTFTESFKSFLIDQAPADSCDPYAKTFQDDNTTTQLVHLRDALMQHLRADDRAEQLFSQSVDINQAKERLAAIITTLPEAEGMNPTDIAQVAEEVADVYWNR